MWRGAREIDDGFALLTVNRDFDLDCAALVHLVGEVGAVQTVDHAPDMFGGIVLHMAHIGAYDGQPEIGDRLLQLPHALLIGGDLCLQIIDVLHDITHRIARTSEEGAHSILAKMTLFDDAEIIDIDAFLFNRHRPRRHGSGCDAANIGVVAARGDPEQDVRVGIVKNRRAHRNIGQMRAAIIGRIEHKHVAGADRARIQFNNRLDRAIH